MFIFCSFILKEPYIDKTRVGAFGKVRIFSMCEWKNPACLCEHPGCTIMLLWVSAWEPNRLQCVKNAAILHSTNIWITPPVRKVCKKNPAVCLCGSSGSTITSIFVPQVYGGYVTSLLVSGEESPVKCGAVLSPITDFELYGNFLCMDLFLLYVVNKHNHSGSGIAVV